MIVAPRNNFPLKEDADLVVLLAGGIGITPIYCMVKRLVELKRPWQLHYSNRSRADAAFLKDLSQYGDCRFHFDDESAGQVPADRRDRREGAQDRAFLLLRTGADAGGVRSRDGGLAARADPCRVLHAEIRGAAKAASRGDSARSKRELTIPPGKSILQAGARSGHPGAAFLRGRHLRRVRDARDLRNSRTIAIRS
jgi:ferredoxin-NADP reductase